MSSNIEVYQSLFVEISFQQTSLSRRFIVFLLFGPVYFYKRSSHLFGPVLVLFLKSFYYAFRFGSQFSVPNLLWS